MADFRPVFIALPFVAALLYAGRWSSRRFARFTELPGHLDFAGKGTRMSPRKTMVWLLPVTFSIVLLGTALLASLLPRDMQNSDPSLTVMLSGVIVVLAEVLFLWLTERWARSRS